MTETDKIAQNAVWSDARSGVYKHRGSVPRGKDMAAVAATGKVAAWTESVDATEGKVANRSLIGG